MNKSNGMPRSSRGDGRRTGICFDPLRGRQQPAAQRGPSQAVRQEHGGETVGTIEGKYPHDFYKVIRAEHSTGSGDGPAFMLHNKATGIVTYEAWMKDGKQGRADGPALIERDDTTGIVTCEEWWKDGKSIQPPSVH